MLPGDGELSQAEIILHLKMGSCHVTWFLVLFLEIHSCNYSANTDGEPALCWPRAR